MAATSIGFIGVVLIVLAYLLHQLGKWDRKDFIYDATNTLGAAMLLIHAYTIMSWPFIILSVAWLGVSGYDVYNFIRPAPKRAVEDNQARKEEETVKITELPTEEYPEKRP